MKLILPSISYILARSRPKNVIGYKNQLPWHLSSDLKRFKKITLDHAIVMGRRTFDSIGHPLPHRTNIVLSREKLANHDSPFRDLNGTTTVLVENRETAIFYADIVTLQKNQTEFFVIGGEHMFDLFGDLFNKVYITEVFAGEEIEGDSFFDFNFDRRKWEKCAEERLPWGPKDEYPSHFSIMERKIKTVRYIYLADYYTEFEARQKWLADKADIIKKRRKKTVSIQHQYNLELDSLR